MQLTFCMETAVLIITFNRKEKTFSCLHILNEQPLTENSRLAIYLTNNASAHGTTEVVKTVFLNADAFHDTGSLFWTGGMRKSWI